MTTRAPGTRRRSSSIAATPSRFGMTRSIRTTPGSRRSASRTASWPSAASPTTSRPSCRPRNVRSPSRTTPWSSAIRTRIGSAPGTVHLEAHGRPRTRRRADLEPAADALGALLHRGQPQVRRTQAGRTGIEADAVVRDLEPEEPVLAGEPHDDPRGVGVAERVLERLLGDAEDLPVAGGVAGGARIDLQLDLALLQPPQDVDVLAEGAPEPVAVEVGRPQLEDQRAQLVERVAGDAAELR